MEGSVKREREREGGIREARERGGSKSYMYIDYMHVIKAAAVYT